MVSTILFFVLRYKMKSGVVNLSPEILEVPVKFNTRNRKPSLLSVDHVLPDNL